MPVAPFGLGAHDTIHRVEVRWSDNTQTVIEHPLPANREYAVERKS